MQLGIRLASITILRSLALEINVLEDARLEQTSQVRHFPGPPASFPDTPEIALHHQYAWISETGTLSLLQVRAVSSTHTTKSKRNTSSTPRSVKSDSRLHMADFFAVMWLMLVACVPLWMAFILPSRKLTSIHVMQGVIVMLWLVLSVYSFTSVFRYRSPHYEGDRTLTLSETVYFTALIITTIGFTDYTPASEGGEIFVSVYALLTLAFVVDILAEAISWIMKAIEMHSRARLVHSMSKVAPKVEICDVHEELLRTVSIPRRSLVQAVVVYIGLAAVGIVFFMRFPGENKTFAQAFYITVQAMTTVGCTDVLPNTDGGKVFAAFWMLAGVAALLHLIFTIGRVMQALKCWEQLAHKKHELEEIRQSLNISDNSGVNKFDFMRLCLASSKLVTTDDLHFIEQTFAELDADNTGIVDLATVQKLETSKQLETQG